MAVIRLARCLMVVCSAVVIGRGLWWAAAEPIQELTTLLVTGAAPAGGVTFDRFIVGIAACGAVVATAMLMVSALLIVLATLTGSTFPWLARLAKVSGPPWWRRAVLTVCGLVIATPAAATAAAAHHTDHHGGCATSCAVRLDGLSLPDLPVADPPDRIIVRTGDSLWSLAGDDLGPRASDTEIARRVDALYAANRSTIGPDPDLIFPGTHLHAPGGSHD